MAALARAIGVALLFAAWVGAAWVMSGTAVRAQDKKTVWDKVYTAEQATKGKVEYDNHCAGCHVKDLSGRDGGGEGPELAEPRSRKSGTSRISISCSARSKRACRAISRPRSVKRRTSTS